MKPIAIGDIRVSSIIERDGPWRHPADFYPDIDPAYARQRLLLPVDHPTSKRSSRPQNDIFQHGLSVCYVHFAPAKNRESGRLGNEIVGQGDLIRRKIEPKRSSQSLL